MRTCWSAQSPGLPCPASRLFYLCLGQGLPCPAAAALSAAALAHAALRPAAFLLPTAATRPSAPVYMQRPLEPRPLATPVAGLLHRALRLLGPRPPCPPRWLQRPPLRPLRRRYHVVSGSTTSTESPNPSISALPAVGGSSAARRVGQRPTLAWRVWPVQRNTLPPRLLPALHALEAARQSKHVTHLQWAAERQGRRLSVRLDGREQVENVESGRRLARAIKHKPYASNSRMGKVYGKVVVSLRNLPGQLHLSTRWALGGDRGTQDIRKQGVSIM